MELGGGAATEFDLVADMRDDDVGGVPIVMDLIDCHPTSYA